MTIRKACFVSLSVHILLFGSALAFAQYARGVFGRNPGPIMVELVGSGETAAQREGTKRRREKTSPQVDPVRQTADVAVQHEADGFSEKKDQSVEEVDDLQGNRGADPADSAAGQAGSGGSALIAPEQWQLIQTAIERVKSYPRLARQRGIEGVVRLRFRITPSGAVEKVEIVKSSSQEILDAASVRTIYRAGPMPYVNGWVEVPISYVLK